MTGDIGGKTKQAENETSEEDEKKSQPSRSVLNGLANGNVYLCTVIRLKEGVGSERDGGGRRTDEERRTVERGQNPR